MLDKTTHNTHEGAMGIHLPYVMQITRGGNEVLNCTTDLFSRTNHKKHCNSSAKECRCKVSTAVNVSWKYTKFCVSQKKPPVSVKHGMPHKIVVNSEIATLTVHFISHKKQRKCTCDFTCCFSQIPFLILWCRTNLCICKLVFSSEEASPSS